MFFSLFSLAFSQTICFYNTDKSRCHPDYESVNIPYSNFKDFEKIVEEKPTSLYLYFADSMPNDLKIDIPDYNGTLYTFGFKENEVKADVYITERSYNSTILYAANYINLHLERNVINATKLYFVETIFTCSGKVFIEANFVDADIYTFSQVNTVKVLQKFYVHVKDFKFPVKGNDFYIRVDNDLLTKVLFNFERNYTYFNILGNDLFVASKETTEKVHFIFLSNLKNRVVLFNNQKNNSVEMNCFSRGPHYHNFNFLLTLNESTVIIPKSLWPTLNSDDDAIVYILRNGPGTVYIGMFKAPIKFHVSNYPLEIISTEKTTGIDGALRCGLAPITIRSLVKDSTFNVKQLFADENSTIINLSPTHQMFIDELMTPEMLEHHFKGDGYYCINRFPDSIATLYFSNLRLRKPKATQVIYRLNASVKIIVEGDLIMKNDKGYIVPIFVFDTLPNATYIDSLVGTKYDLLCAKDFNTSLLDIKFSDFTPMRGFSKGTEIFERREGTWNGMKCLQMEITKKYSEVGYQFCISKDPSICDETEIPITNKEDFNKWSKYSTYENTILEFSVYDEMTDDDGNIIPYNFDGYNSSEMFISFSGKKYDQNVKIAIDKNVLSRKGSVIAFNEVDVTVEDGWDGNLRTGISIRNSVFNKGPVSMKVAAEGVDIESDYSSFQYINTLIPDTLTLTEITYNKVIMRENEVIIGLNPSELEYTIPCKNSKPAIHFKINDKLTIIKPDNVNSGLVPLHISKFGDAELIIDGEFPDNYTNIYLENFDGGIVRAKHEKIPLSTDGSDFEIRSSLNKLVVNGEIGLDADAVFKLTGENGTVSIGNGSFGKNTNITIANVSSFIVQNAAINGVVESPIEALHVSKSLFVEQGASARIRDLIFDSDTSIKVNFTPGNIPYVVADRKRNLETKPKDFVLNVVTSQYVNTYLNDAAKMFMNRSMELFCGQNLDCYDWNMRVEIPEPIDAIPFKLQCRSSFKNRTCVSVRTIDSNDDEEGDDSKDGSGMSVGTYVVTAISAIGFIGIIVIAIVVLVRRRCRTETEDTRKDPLLSSVQELI